MGRFGRAPSRHDRGGVRRGRTFLKQGASSATRAPTVPKVLEEVSKEERVCEALPQEARHADHGLGGSQGAFSKGEMTNGEKEGRA